MAFETIKRQIADFPREPGVYLMKDAQGRVLYVGKAKSLRTRVASYFVENPSDDRAHIAQMLPLVASVECVEAESEVEALLMESRLIKDIQPRFNRNLRDDKIYPYLELSRGDDFPGVYITRQQDSPKSRYYGPFTDVTGLRRAVPIMQAAFRFRTCSMEVRADDRKRRFQRPCLLHAIKRCLAPCADLCSREDYADMVRLLQRFLAGQRKGVLAELKRQMYACSGKREYEKAARLRDQMSALESLGKRGEVDVFSDISAAPVIDPAAGLAELGEVLGLDEPPRTIDGVDVAHLSGEAAVASVVRFVDGRPFKDGYRRFRIKTVEGIDDYAMMAEVVGRRFRRILDAEEVAPDVLLLDGGAGQLSAVLRRLEEINAPPVTVLSLAKREELVHFLPGEEPLRLKRSSLALRMLQYVRDEAHRFAQHYHHLLRDKGLVDRKGRRRGQS